MLRLAITLASCLLFLLFGCIGETVFNPLLAPFRQHPDRPLPGLTLLILQSFPLNNGYFISSVFPFCAAMFVVLLLTSSRHPLFPSHYFAKLALLVLILFGIYLGIIILGITMPFLVTGIEEHRENPNALNIAFSILNGLLWIAVLGLLIRNRINQRKKSP